MSISLNLNVSALVRRTGVIPPQYIARIDELLSTGQFKADEIPTPPTWSELPMLSVADLLEEQENQRRAGDVAADVKLAIPDHWSTLDAVIPVLPPQCGSMRLYVEAHEWMATVAALKGVDIRTGLPVEKNPIYGPRQNFFMGSFDIGGTLHETSNAVTQWMVVPPSAAQFDTSRQVGVADTMLADGFSLAFHPHRLVQKYFSIGSSSGFYGQESMRTLSPLAMAMPMAKGFGEEALEIALIEEVMIAPGGTMAGNYPDDPSILEGDLQTDSWISFWIRLVPVSVYNRFAKAINASEVEQKTITAAKKAQLEFERSLGKFLSIGVDTGTNVTGRLQRVPGDLQFESILE